MTESTKYCALCEKEHPLSFYHRDRHQPDGLHRTCRACRASQYRRSQLLAKHRDRAGYFRRKAEKWKARALAAESSRRSP